MPFEPSPLRQGIEVLKARAWWFLKNSEQLPPHLGDNPLFQGNARLRIWDNRDSVPMDWPPMSLTVYEVLMNDEELRFVLREAIWQCKNDIHRILGFVEDHEGNPSFTGAPVLDPLQVEPTIIVRDSSVREMELHGLLKEAASFRLPVVWLEKQKCASSGLREVGFEYYSADGPPAVLRFQWSHEIPNGWASFVAWFEKLRQFLLSSLEGPRE